MLDDALPWLSRPASELLRKWCDSISLKESVDRFVFVGVGSEVEIREVAAYIAKRFEKLNVKTGTHHKLVARMNSNFRKPTVYVVTSMPNRLQQSRLASLTRAQRNFVAILVEKAAQSDFEPSEPNVAKLNYRIVPLSEPAETSASDLTPG